MGPDWEPTHTLLVHGTTLQPPGPPGQGKISPFWVPLRLMNFYRINGQNAAWPFNCSFLDFLAKTRYSSPVLILFLDCTRISDSPRSGWLWWQSSIRVRQACRRLSYISHCAVGLLALLCSDTFPEDLVLTGPGVSSSTLLNPSGAVFSLRRFAICLSGFEPLASFPFVCICVLYLPTLMGAACRLCGPNFLWCNWMCAWLDLIPQPGFMCAHCVVTCSAGRTDHQPLVPSATFLSVWLWDPHRSVLLRAHCPVSVPSFLSSSPSKTASHCNMGLFLVLLALGQILLFSIKKSRWGPGCCGSVEWVPTC